MDNSTLGMVSVLDWWHDCQPYLWYKFTCATCVTWVSWWKLVNSSIGSNPVPRKATVSLDKAWIREGVVVVVRLRPIWSDLRYEIWSDVKWDLIWSNLRCELTCYLRKTWSEIGKSPILARINDDSFQRRCIGQKFYCFSSVFIVSCRNRLWNNSKNPWHARWEIS